MEQSVKNAFDYMFPPRQPENAIEAFIEPDQEDDLSSETYSETSSEFYLDTFSENCDIVDLCEQLDTVSQGIHQT